MTTKENLKTKIFNNLYKNTTHNDVKDPFLCEFIDSISNQITSSKLVDVNLFIEDSDAWKYDNLEDYVDYFSFESIESVPNNFISDFNNKKNMGWHYSFKVPELFLPFFPQLIKKENINCNGDYEESKTLPSFVKVEYQLYSYIPFLTDETFYMKSSDHKLIAENPDCKRVLQSAVSFIDNQINDFLQKEKQINKSKKSVQH